ncbi:MAG TPA: aminotransferase class I/II-fold pyridoxal phosphate-dependent enzyme [Candidatus Paceibacterota bacterium]|nr:aminotransferase class I/II-fold pyridoxal phosphate-dependent enzyme [Candidatus Paceibacterota bacterium]
MAGKKIELREKTLEIHGNSGESAADLRPALHRTIAFPLGSLERGRRLFAGEEEGFIYSRINNPTTDALEKRLAALEGAEAALVTSSGMSAIFLVALHLASGGGHFVSSNRLYGGVYHLFHERLKALGILATFAEDPFNMDRWDAAIGPTTRFFYVETPSNPLIDLIDIAALAKIAHRHRLPLVVDSTLATPALLRPLAHGADIGVASLSKYMGDGEVIGGAVFGRKKMIDALRLGWFRDTGPCMSSDNAQILCYHIESLHARMREHSVNAAQIAKFLSRHPKVKRVFYPSFGPRAAANRALMPDGFGGLMAIELRGGKAATRTALESLKIFWHAANIGEARSLVVAPAFETHGQMTPDERSKAGIPDGMLRLSIGREDPRDLIDDLKQALAHVK